MFDIRMRNVFHNELATMSLGSRNKNVIKTKGRKRNPVVKDLNDSSVFVSGKLTLKNKTGSFSFLFPSFFFNIYFFTKSVISFSYSES